MFITIQFPLVDYRSLEDTPSRLDIPQWPDPDPEEDNILYFGKIFNRETKYWGPWDGEKRYCNVKSVINFCGLKDEHFYNLLGVPWSSVILFRRFQSDGKFLAKFEVGFYDHFEYTQNFAELSPQQIREQLYAHINRYLLCPVKIKKGSRKFNKNNRYHSFTPLIHIGNQLAGSYYWATYQTGTKRTFEDSGRKNHVVKCDPLVVVQLDASRIPLANLPLHKTDITALNNPNLSLFYDFIPHTYDRNKYNTKSWIIGLNPPPQSMPLGASIYNSSDDAVRNLRMNLIRLHAEVVVLNKVLERIGQNRQGDMGSAEVKRRVIHYLHKILYNLSKSKRNAQPQESFVQVAIQLEEIIAGHHSIEDQVEGLKFVIEELKQLTQNPANQQIINYSYKYYNQMGDQITIGTINGNFVNKSQLINSLNAITSNGMSEEFRQEMLQIAKKIEEDQNELAATVLNTLNEELAKPKEQQDKSKIRKFWDGLVKIMPDVATIGKTIASVIALF